METNIIVQDRTKENVIELSVILNKIYDIRGYKVILDFDLAERYGVETKRLKEAVRRNMNRFPNDFMFELTDDEWKSLRSQFATSNSLHFNKNDTKFEAIFKLFDEFISHKKELEKPRTPIGFKQKEI